MDSVNNEERDPFHAEICAMVRENAVADSREDDDGDRRTVRNAEDGGKLKSHDLMRYALEWLNAVR